MCLELRKRSASENCVTCAMRGTQPRSEATAQGIFCYWREECAHAQTCRGACRRAASYNVHAVKSDFPVGPLGDVNHQPFSLPPITANAKTKILQLLHHVMICVNYSRAFCTIENVHKISIFPYTCRSCLIIS